MRVIARLDIKGPNVVKTVRTEGLRAVGTPRPLSVTTRMALTSWYT
jgi:imidazole glycerol phosphate synthase subunit HisF